MRLGMVLAGASILALASCSPAGETPVATPDPVVKTETDVLEADTATDSAAKAPIGFMVHGDANWTAELPAVDEPMLIVEVIERNIDGERAKASSSQPLEGGPPLTFRIPVPRQSQEVMDMLILRARVQDGYAILLTTDGDIDISGGTTDLDIMLYNPEDLVRGRAGKMITPAGKDYTCGGEVLTIAVEAGAAYVTFPDGSSVKLNKLDTAEGAKPQYSNGKMLVEQTADGLAFGRGRATPLPCLE